MQQPVEVHIECRGRDDTITLHLRPAKNGYIAAFGSDRGPFNRQLSDGEEIVATSIPALKRSVMAEFEARFNAKASEIKAIQSKTAPKDGAGKRGARK